MSNDDVPPALTVQGVVDELRVAADAATSASSAAAAAAASSGVGDDLAVQALLKLAGVSTQDDLLAVEAAGGVASLQTLAAARDPSDASDLDFKLLLMMVMQALLAAEGSVREAVSSPAHAPLVDAAAASASTLLTIAGVEGGTAADVLQVKLQAASCLNVLPLAHERWVEMQIPEICMELLSDATFVDTPPPEDEEVLRNFGATNLLDAGLLLTVNFTPSRAFFDVVMTYGLCEQVVQVGRTICAQPALYTESTHVATLIRLLTLLLVLYAVPEARRKLEFLEGGVDEGESLTKQLLPHLAMHENMAVRSLSYQALALYTGVTEQKHEWVDCDGEEEESEAAAAAAAASVSPDAEATEDVAKNECVRA